MAKSNLKLLTRSIINVSRMLNSNPTYLKNFSDPVKHVIKHDKNVGKKKVITISKFFWG